MPDGLNYCVLFNMRSGAGAVYFSVPFAPDTSKTRRNRWEWLLLGLVLLTLAGFLAYAFVASRQWTLSTERERLTLQANTIATDMGRNLAATNRAIEGVLRDFLSGAMTEADVT